MASVTEAEIRLLLKARNDASATVKKVEKDIGGLGSTIKNVMTTAAGFGVGMMGLGAIGGIFNAISGSAIGLNSLLQQSEVAFSTMLGSADAAKAHLDELSKFAAKTPFEFPDLVMASKRMMAFGFESKQVIPLMTAIGGAASAMGSGKMGIDQLTRALGQMQAKGKVSGEELLQLQEGGIKTADIFEIMGKKVGKSGKDIAAAVSKGTVASEDFIDAFQEFSKLKFGDMMEKQSKTFEGAMSTVKDSINMGIAKGAKPLFDLMTTQMMKLADFLSGDTFSNAVDGMARLMAGALTLMISLFGSLGQAIFPITTMIGDLVNVGKLLFSGDFQGGIFGLEEDDPIIDVLLNIREGALALIGVFRNLDGAGLALHNTLESIFGAEIANKIIGIIKAVQSLIGVFQTTDSKGLLLHNTLERMLGLGVANFIIAIVKAFEAWKPALLPILEYLGRLTLMVAGNTLKNFVSILKILAEVFTSIAKILTPLINDFAGLGTKMSDVQKPSDALAKTLAGLLVTWLAILAVKKTVEFTQRIVRTGQQFIQGIRDVIQTITQTIKRVGQWITDFAAKTQQIIQNITRTGAKWIDDFTSKTQEVTQNVKMQAVKVEDAAKNAAEKFATAFAGALAGAMTGAGVITALSSGLGAALLAAVAAISLPVIAVALAAALVAAIIVIKWPELSAWLEGNFIDSAGNVDWGRIAGFILGALSGAFVALMTAGGPMALIANTISDSISDELEKLGIKIPALSFDISIPDIVSSVAKYATIVADELGKAISNIDIKAILRFDLAYTNLFVVASEIGIRLAEELLKIRLKLPDIQMPEVDFSSVLQGIGIGWNLVDILTGGWLSVITDTIRNAAPGMGLAAGRIVEVIVTTVSKIGEKGWSWGSDLVGNIANGIIDSLPGLRVAVNLVGQLFPMHSPAAVGPLSTEPDWEFLSEGLPDVIDDIGEMASELEDVLSDIPEAVEAAAKAPAYENLGSALIELSKKVETGADTLKKATKGVATQTAEDLAKTVSSIADAISKGVEALNKLSKVKTVAQESFDALEDGMKKMLGVMVSLSGGWEGVTAKSILGAKALSEAIGPIMEAIGKAADALSKLKNFQALTEQNVFDFVNAVTTTLIFFAAKAEEIGQKMAEITGEFLSAIGPGIESIGKSIDFFTKLKTFESVTEENVFDFVNATITTLIFFAAKAEEIGQDMADIAAEFLLTIGPAIESIGKAIDFFTKLKDFKPITEENVFDFVNATITTLVFFLAKAEEIGQDIAEIAAKFMSTIGPAIDNIGKSIDFFIKLKDFKPVLEVNVLDFVNAVTTTLVFFLAKAIEIGQEMAEIAAKFLIAIGPAIESIGKSIDFFTKLQDFKAVPEANIRAFVDAVIAAMLMFFEATLTITQEMADIVAKWAASVGPAISSLGSTIDTFTKLRTFAPVPAENIQAFADAVIVAMQAFYAATLIITLQMAQVVKLWADNVGPAIEEIGKNIDFFTKLRFFVAPPQESIQAFTDTLIVVMQNFYAATGVITQKMADTVKLWADAVGPAIAELGQNLEFFTKLRWFVKPLDENIQAFVDTTIVVMAKFFEATKVITQKMADTVKLWADSVGPAIAELGQNLEFFTKLRWFVAPLAENVQAFVDTTGMIIQMFFVKSQILGQRMADIVKVWMDSVGPAVEQIGKALEVAQKLRGFAGLQEPNVRAFVDGIDQILIWFYRRSVIIGIRVADTAKIWVDAVGPMVETIGKALDATQKLRGFAGLQEPNVRAFVDGIDQVLIWFYRRSLLIGIRVADTAKTWIDAVGPAVETIGKAIEPLAKLKGFAGIQEQNIRAFVDAVDLILVFFYRKSIAIGQYVGDTAKAWLDAVGPAIESIGKSIDFFTKLKDFEDVSEQAIVHFVEATVRTIIFFYRKAVEIGQYVADTAKAWLDSVGPGVESIGKSVDFFTKLRDFTSIPEQAVINFVEVTIRTIIFFYRKAIEIGQYVADTANVFNAAVGPAIESVGKTIDFFDKLRVFAPIPERAINDFVGAIERTITLLYEKAVEIGQYVADTAQVWAEAVGPAIESIGKTLATFEKLKDFEKVSEKIIIPFIENVKLMVVLMYQAAEALGPLVGTVAKLFGDIAGSIGDNLSKVLNVFKTISEGKIDSAAIQALVDLIVSVVKKLAALTESPGAIWQLIDGFALLAEKMVEVKAIFGDAVDTITASIDQLSSIMEDNMSVVNAWRDTLVKAIDDVITALNRLPAGSGVPTPGGSVPAMAAGGLVMSPSLVSVAEAGPEIIQPLNNITVNGNVNLGSANSREEWQRMLRTIVPRR